MPARARVTSVHVTVGVKEGYQRLSNMPPSDRKVDSRGNPRSADDDEMTPTQLGDFIAEQDYHIALQSCTRRGQEPSVGSRKRPQVMSPGFDCSTTF
jgi:hypothetical protein